MRLVASLIMPLIAFIMVPIGKAVFPPLRWDRYSLKSAINAMSVIVMMITVFVGTCYGIHLLNTHKSSDVLLAVAWLVQARTHSNHILHSGPHMLIVSLGFVLIHLEESTSLCLVLLAHAGILVGLLIYKSLSQHMQWYAGCGWGWSLLLAGAFNMFARIDSGLLHQSLVRRLIVHCWLGALTVLTVHAQWPLLIEVYKSWQDQHASFRLLSTGAVPAPLESRHHTPASLVRVPRSLHESIPDLAVDAV